MVPKRKTPRKRKQPSTPTKKRRTTRRKKKGFLSEFITAAESKGGFKAVAMGALGAVPAIAIEKVASTSTPEQQSLIQMAVGFGLATIGRAPYVGAGTAAIGAYNLLKTTGMLNDDWQEAQYTQDMLQNLPLMMENGEMSYMQETGSLMQEGYQVPYAPNFGGPQF